MRVVVDTNVLVSAVLKDQSLPALGVHTAVRRGVLLKSHATEQQLLAVVARPRLAPLIAPAARAWLKGVLDLAELVPIIERIVACRDATDDKFLELAVNGRADLILSGDGDLLTLHPFRGIPILAPATFVQAARSP
jgi:putative PIN family toxin of toxin-antitoxin system